MEALCESDLILTQLTPTVCCYLELSFFQLTAEIQLVLRSLTSHPPPKRGRKEGKKTVGLLLFGEWGLFSFALLFRPVLRYKSLHSLPCWMKFHQYTCCGWTAFLWQSLNTVTG